MRKITSIMLFLLASSFCTVSAEETSYKEVLMDIKTFASDYCGVLFEGGEKTEFSGKGKAEASLSKFIKKLVDLGISGAADFNTSSYTGVLHEHLKDERDATRQCKLKLWDDLKSLIPTSSVRFKQAPVKEKPFGVSATCRGDWMYYEYKSCPDKNMPVHPMITDSKICGADTVKEYRQTHKYSLCEHQEHGVARYKDSKVVDGWSGWRKGGYNQPAWCNDLKSAFQKGKPTITWSNQTSKEQHKTKRDPFKRDFYNYYCKATASWNPVYKKARTKNCPKAGPELVTISKPRTCPDESRVLEYQDTTRKACGTQEGIIIAHGNSAGQLFPIFSDGKISEPKCSTCDGLIENSD